MPLCSITADADYVTQVVTLEFMPGVTTRSVNVAIQNDDTAEAGETFFGNLNDAGDPVIRQPDVATVFIIDDDRMSFLYHSTCSLSRNSSCSVWHCYHHS